MHFSLQIFRKADIEPIISYALERLAHSIDNNNYILKPILSSNRYFKRFSMYSYIFGTQTKVILRQVTPHEVEFPAPQLPLSEAIESIILS